MRYRLGINTHTQTHHATRTRILGVVLVCLGLALAVIIARQTFESLVAYGWQSSKCTIEKSDVLFSAEGDGDGRCMHALEYSYDVGGQRRLGNVWRLDPGQPYEWCSAWASFAGNFVPQFTLDCYVDPTNPNRVVLDRGNLFSVLVLLFPIGIIFGGGCLLRKKAAPSAEVTKSRVRLIAQFIAVGAFLAGALGTFFAGVIPLYEVFSARAWQENKCDILSSALRTSSASTTGGGSSSRGYQIEIIYTYKVGQQTYVTDRYDFMKMGSGDDDALSKVTDNYPVGASDPCWIDSHNPYEAVLNRDFSSKYLWGFLPLLASLAGVLLFAGARKIK